MKSSKFKAGDAFPEITLPKVGGGELTLGKPLHGRHKKPINPSPNRAST